MMVIDIFNSYIMLIDLIVLLFFTTFTAFFVVFLDFCFNEGNILEKYYIFISDKYLESNPKLFKLLGGCIYCFGSWVFIGLYLLFNIYYPLPFVFIFLGLGINFIVINMIEKSFDN